MSPKPPRPYLTLHGTVQTPLLQGPSPRCLKVPQFPWFLLESSQQDLQLTKDSDLYPPGAVSCRTSCCLGAEGGDRVVRKDPEQDMLQLGVRVEAEKD